MLTRKWHHWILLWFAMGAVGVILIGAAGFVWRIRVQSLNAVDEARVSVVRNMEQGIGSDVRPAGTRAWLPAVRTWEEQNPVRRQFSVPDPVRQQRLREDWAMAARRLHRHGVSLLEVSGRELLLVERLAIHSGLARLERVSSLQRSGFLDSARVQAARETQGEAERILARGGDLAIYEDLSLKLTHLLEIAHGSPWEDAVRALQDRVQVRHSRLLRLVRSPGTEWDALHAAGEVARVEFAAEATRLSPSLRYVMQGSARDSLEVVSPRSALEWTRLLAPASPLRQRLVDLGVLHVTVRGPKDDLQMSLDQTEP